MESGPRPSAPRSCRNCLVPYLRLEEERCSVCAKYWHIYGHEQPPRSWFRPAPKAPDSKP